MTFVKNIEKASVGATRLPRVRDVHPLLRRLGLVSFTEAGTRLISFIAFPVITRRLGPSTYGQVAYAMALTSWLGLLASPGFYTYGLRQVALDSSTLRRTVADVVTVRLLLALVVYGGLVGYTILGVAGPVNRQLLILYGAMFVVDALDTSWAFIGMQRVVVVSALVLVTNVFYVAAVISIIHGPSQAPAVPTIQLSQNVVVIAGLMALFWRWWGSWPIRVDLRRWWDLTRESFVLGFATLMTMTYNRVDVVLVRIFRGTADAGLYSAVYRLMEMALLLTAVLVNVVFPVITAAIGRSLAEAQDKIDLYLRHFFVLAIPLSIGGAIVSDELASFVLGSAYGRAGTVFAILIFNFVIGGTASLFSGCVLVSLRMNRQYVWTVTLGAIVNVLANLALIPRYGMTAAAATTLGAQLVVVGSAAWLVRKKIRLHIVRHLLRPVLAALVMVGTLLLTCIWTTALWATLPVGVMAYGVAITMLRGIDPRLLSSVASSDKVA